MATNEISMAAVHTAIIVVIGAAVPSNTSPAMVPAATAAVACKAPSSADAVPAIRGCGASAAAKPVGNRMPKPNVRTENGSTKLATLNHALAPTAANARPAAAEMPVAAR